MPPDSLQDILIVEDQHLMRLALVREMQAAIPACVIHAAATMETALELIRTNQFALILIDPGLPGYDPGSEVDRIQTISAIVSRTPTAIHVVITGSESAQEWEDAQRLGVAGYIAKNSLKPGTMGAVLQTIADHGRCVGLMHETSVAPELYHAVLSPREQEAVQWMMQRPADISRKVIFDQLGEHLEIDAASAERYYKRARAKLLKFGQLPNSI
ncbi:response regulator transcription factor [Phyllobacterium endophyticum]|jgi:DNA-binding NarL/FixJ family response regulator|uniref:DNA-binding response regulator n=1 Tax=Phyllobacterium endophyticum TaxID=1149773 RepID=A0A2P7B1Y4_9HYPH|nr:response regulator [Phyllobacterium endophyticum]MBB3238073.1 DNA-binding NarL/FixJ family response regulator [Phyllobacterium endophyticum]PSH60486.1 DNA-binding response regulator [Phyllobacterium endophyticum]TYR42662.1 response regulator transcription factor [Phyllobacterium endophyticum]